jgi:NhaP-type Na+/H+ or K+/H+ antiporter
MSMILSYVIYRFAPENNKKTLTRIVSLQLIYKALLPPIVLAEGFNLRKQTIGKFGKEVFSVGIVIPLLTLFCLTMTIYGTASISHLMPGMLKKLKLK